MPRHVQCVNPTAPIVKCCICGAQVHTCEKVDSENNSSLCPAHPDGCQIGEHGHKYDLKYTCSDRCYELAEQEICKDMGWDYYGITI